MVERFKTGTITSTHGIKGEVKVYPASGDLSHFEYLKECIIDTGKEEIVVEVENVKFFKNQAILKFKGYDNINDIEKYKGASLMVTRENAVPLEKGEFYIADIIDAAVYDETGAELGILTDVLETGANDVYVVKTQEGKEILLPAIPECILEVDTETPKVVVHLMKGLLD